MHHSGAEIALRAMLNRKEMLNLSEQAIQYLEREIEYRVRNKESAEKEIHRVEAEAKRD